MINSNFRPESLEQAVPHSLQVKGHINATPGFVQRRSGFASTHLQFRFNFLTTKSRGESVQVDSFKDGGDEGTVEGATEIVAEGTADGKPDGWFVGESQSPKSDDKELQEVDGLDITIEPSTITLKEPFEKIPSPYESKIVNV